MFTQLPVLVYTCLHHLDIDGEDGVGTRGVHVHQGGPHGSILAAQLHHTLQVMDVQDLGQRETTKRATIRIGGWNILIKALNLSYWIIAMAPTL